MKSYTTADQDLKIIIDIIKDKLSSGPLQHSFQSGQIIALARYVAQSGLDSSKPVNERILDATKIIFGAIVMSYRVNQCKFDYGTRDNGISLYPTELWLEIPGIKEFKELDLIMMRHIGGEVLKDERFLNGDILQRKAKLINSTVTTPLFPALAQDNMVKAIETLRSHVSALMLENTQTAILGNSVYSFFGDYQDSESQNNANAAFQLTYSSTSH